MKKHFSVRMIVILLVISVLTGFSAFAEQANIPFDYTVFEKLDGYSYDKFEDTWTYFQVYTEKYSDAYVYIGINITGDEQIIDMGPLLYVKIVNPLNGEPLHIANSIDFIIDDTKYSYNSMLKGTSSSSVLLGTEGKKLVEAFSQCKSVAAKITLEYNSLTIDLDQSQVDKTLKVISQELLDKNVWDYIFDPLVETSESAFPLTIK